MGTLYLGRRIGAAGFTQHVAIKVIHPHLSNDQGFVSLFVNEALLGARIEHPNVVRMEELAEEKGLYFLAMEYVHGCSIGELLKKLRDLKRTLTPEVAVSIAGRVAEGLQAVHETKDAGGKPLELVHRDVSPSNILLSTNGGVKLIDFGIAKAMAQGVGTATGSLKGKIRYMSPEQAYGRPLDRRSDIYSLAIVLWEMLTRQRMFKKGDDLAVLDRVRSPNIEPPSHFRSDVPKTLDAAVMHALAREPSGRFQTARDFRMSIFAAVPRAHEIDSSRLADLLAEVMPDEIAAIEAMLPSEARALVPRRPDSVEPTAMTVTAEISEGPLAEPAAQSIELPAEPRSWPWIGATALLAILGVLVAWLLLVAPQPNEAPIQVDPIQARPAEPPPAEPPPVTAPPPDPVPPPVVEETKEIERPRPKKGRIQRKRRAKRAGERPTKVDGVPLLEDPGF
jgi:serine/threonine-protein kinase